MTGIAEWILARFLGEGRKKRIRVLKILITLLLGFIVCNSMIPGDLSEVESQSVAYFIFKNSEVMSVALGELPWVLAHAIVRKIGHFLEYACLAMLMVFYETMKLQEAKGITLPGDIQSVSRSVLVSLLRTGALMGLLDESVQLVTPGRWGSIMDIWIDSLGFFIGMIVTWGVGKLLVRYVRGRGKETA